MTHRLINTTALSAACLVLSCTAQAAVYPIHTFGIKPISFSMLNMPTGKVKQSAQIEGTTVDSYRTVTGFGVGETEKFNHGYSFEMGYFIYDNVEWTGKFSYIDDKAQKHIVWALRTPEGDAFGPAYGYQFKSRESWGVSTGLNYYFDKFNRWLPFAGASLGVIFQSATKANVHFTNALAGYDLGNLGEVTLQPSKRRYKGAFQLGTDFKIDERWVITMATGLHYLSHNKTNYTVFQGRTIPYRDNENQVTIPFTVSLKMILA